MAKAIWFFIKISIELLFIFVIIYKGEINNKISINIIFLYGSQSFGLLLDVLHFKLD